jgi:hypothetical protein
VWRGEGQKCYFCFKAFSIKDPKSIKERLKVRQCERKLFPHFRASNFKNDRFQIPETGTKYRALMGSKFSQNNCFDSVFNQIFDYVYGTHCLN